MDEVGVGKRASKIVLEVPAELGAALGLVVFQDDAVHAHLNSHARSLVLRATSVGGAAEKDGVHMDLRVVFQDFANGDCLASKHVVRNVKVVLYVGLVLLILMLKNLNLTETCVPLGA